MKESRSFDRAAEVYDQTRPLFKASIEAGMRSLLEAAGEGARILEVGAETGRISIPLLERGADLIGCDRRVIGNYLRKRDNIFARMESGVNTSDFFRALQAAGAIRQDIDAAAIVHIMEMLSYGQLTIGDFKTPDQSPPYDAVMEGLADIMDRALQPEGGGHSEAGKTIIRQITIAARAQMEHIKQARDTQQAIHPGATNDNR